MINHREGMEAESELADDVPMDDDTKEHEDEEQDMDEVRVLASSLSIIFSRLLLVQEGGAGPSSAADGAGGAPHTPGRKKKWQAAEGSLTKKREEMDKAKVRQPLSARFIPSYAMK